MSADFLVLYLYRLYVHQLTNHLFALLFFSYLIRKSKGLVRDETTGLAGPGRFNGMRYSEIADDLNVLLKRVGQKALKVIFSNSSILLNCIFNHFNYLVFQKIIT